MKSIVKNLCCALTLLLGTGAGHAATINWSASLDHGFSLLDGTNLQAGSLVRIGFFRDPVTQVRLTDAQIQALAGTPALLDASFVSVASSSIGSGVGGLSAHFTSANAVDTAALDLVGKQIYLWVFNAPTLNAASQQAILYWDITDNSNPDSAPIRPSLRWAFPVELPVPGTTNIDLTDLTAGVTTLGTGARVVVGSFPVGTSLHTTQPNFGLAVISNDLIINNTTPLATATRNVMYNQTLVVTGATEGEPVWSIVSGALPPGLALGSETGVISGTPTVNGMYQFTVQVTSGSLISAKQFTLPVANSELQILTTELADALVDRFYTATLIADGGNAPFVWIRTGGGLPPGITMGTDGVLRGTTTVPGSYNFDVSVSDDSGQIKTANFTLHATYEPLIEGEEIMPPGVKGIVYTRQFNIPDGRLYTWSITNGALPPGMTLSATGRLRGASPTPGTYEFTVTASGENSITTSREFSLTILPSNSAPVLETPEFPDTVVGSNGFRYQVIASPQPARISIDGLPPGLKLEASTGWVTGNATVAGVYVVAVRARNRAGSSPISYATIRVTALPANAVGSFNALISPDSAANGNLGGRLDLTTTIRGGFTFTLTQGSVVLRSKGSLTTPEGSLSPRLVGRFGNYQFNLIFDSHNDSVVGTVSSVAANGSLSPANVSGWRQTWTSTNPSNAQFGCYSASLNLASGTVPSLTLPQGAGFVTAKVSTDGRVVFRGRTASGGPISCNSILSRDNRLLLFTRQNSNFGVLQGVINLAIGSDGAVSNTLDGTLKWAKGTNPTTIYPDAFGPVDVTASGAYLSRNVQRGERAVIHVFGLPKDGLASSLTFTGGGLIGAATNPNVENIFFTSGYNNARRAYLVTPIMPTLPTLNPARTRLNIVTNTGLVSGSFTLLDGLTRRTAKYSGVIVRLPGGEIKAEGYFLLPQRRQPGERGPVLQLSGKMQLTQPEVLP